MSGLPGLPVNELRDQLEDLYKACDCHVHDTDVVNTDLAAADDFAELLAKMVLKVWNDKGIKEGQIDAEVTEVFRKKLWSGVVKGYGMDLDAVDYDTPDYEMLEALKKNVYQFASGKNYSQLRELTNALIGEDGKPLSKNDFFRAAAKINDDYCKRFLKVEREFAIGAGQMTSKWVQIEANKDSLPLLEFDAVMDGNTTDKCAAANGVVLPVTHVFWNKYYPQNHWGCRSTVRQLARGRVTPADNIPALDVPPMFQTNLGKEKLVFPKDHPYFIGLPHNLK